MNVDKYHVYDDEAYVTLSQLVPLLLCSTLGSDIPIVTDDTRLQPSERLTEHWKRSIPEFSPASTVKLQDALQDHVPIITFLPMEGVPARKVAIHPDDHYRVLHKTAIPKMGARHPRYMEPHEVTFPALVKIDQALGGTGIIELTTTSNSLKFCKRSRSCTGKQRPNVASFQSGSRGLRRLFAVITTYRRRAKQRGWE